MLLEMVQGPFFNGTFTVGESLGEFEKKSGYDLNNSEIIHGRSWQYSLMFPPP